MAVNSTYSVYKSSKLPSREQKSTWHFSRFHFIGICSCAGKNFGNRRRINNGSSKRFPGLLLNLAKKYPQAQEKLACGNAHGWIVQFFFTMVRLLAVMSCVLRHVAKGR